MTVEDDPLLAKQRIFYNQIRPAAGQIRKSAINKR